MKVGLYMRAIHSNSEVSLLKSVPFLDLERNLIFCEFQTSNSDLVPQNAFVFQKIEQLKFLTPMSLNENEMKNSSHENADKDLFWSSVQQPFDF